MREVDSPWGVDGKPDERSITEYSSGFIVH